MAARWSAFVIWALVAAAVVGWALRLFGPSHPAPAHVATIAPGAPARADLTRLLGAAPPPEVAVAPPPVAASRFRLVGVAAARRPDGAGVALIAVDGKPARAFRAGAVVDGDVVVQQVHARGVALGPRGGPAAVALDLPPLPVAATGTMPPATPTAIPAGSPPGGMPGGMPPGLPGMPSAMPMPAPQGVPIVPAMPMPAPDASPQGLPQS